MLTCRRCRTEFDPGLTTGRSRGRVCPACLPLEQEIARIQTLGLPALAWRHFPGRKFKHLALASWQAVQSDFDQTAGTFLHFALFGSFLEVQILGGVLALDEQSLEFIRVEFSPDPEFFNLQSPAFTQPSGYHSHYVEQHSPVVQKCGSNEDLVVIQLGGDRPLRILISEKYLPGNKKEGEAIAAALSGQPTEPFDYGVEYLALERGITFPRRADLDLIVKPADYGKFAAKMIRKFLPDPDRAWKVKTELAADRVRAVIAAYAADAPDDTILAHMDTSDWYGEAGILLTKLGFYYKIRGAFFGDWSKSWHQGVFAWWQVEDILLDSDLEGRIAQISLVDDRVVRIPLGKTGGIDQFWAVLNQMALLNEHFTLVAAQSSAK